MYVVGTHLRGNSNEYNPHIFYRELTKIPLRVTKYPPYVLCSLLILFSYYLYHWGFGIINQLLPSCDGKMMIFPSKAGNIVRGRSPRSILPVETILPVKATFCHVSK